MKALAAVAVALLLSLTISAGPSLAQTTVMPQGTWQSTCRNVLVQKNILSAECVRPNGVWQRSSIDVNQCPSLLIANKNGSLACEVFGGGSAANPSNFYPAGSWRGTCRNFTMRGTVLSASCMDNTGILRPSSLNVGRCTNHLVANINGMLLCEPQ